MAEIKSAVTIASHRLPPLGPDVRSLDAALAARAAGAPEELAFAMEGERLTYGRLQEKSEELARGLAGLGVGQGDRVALFLPAGLDFIQAFFALQRLGAAPCAFEPGVPAAAGARRAARIRPCLALLGELDSAPAGLLTEALAGMGIRCLALAEARREASKAPAQLPPSPDDSKSIAFLQPTSGTSGEARAAVVLQRQVIASLRATREMVGIGPVDVLVSWVPPWHDLGLMRFVLGPVYFGAPCHLVTPAIRTLPQWLRTAAEVRATVLGAPDFAYRLATRLVDPRGLDLSAVRYATNGGEPVRQSTILAFEERFGVPGAIRPGYGLAEATLGVTGLRPGEPLRVDERGNVSCGRPVPGVEVRIAVAEAGPTNPAERRGECLGKEEGGGVAEVEAGSPAGTIRAGWEVGEILVRGPAVFAGYFEAEEATAEALREGWLHTGDIGRLDADGHLYVLGRKRALLKRGGAPLAPREVEEAVEGVPGLRVAAAVGLPPAMGASTEEIAIVIEADPAADPARVAGAVAAAVEAALGFGPDRVVVLAPRTLPRTTNGKIRHGVLRQALIEGELEARGAVVLTLAGGALRS